MASVKLVFGGQEIGVYKLDKPAMVVGRDERCDIPIDNLGVSRNHCQFIRRGDGFLLQDMNSSNGTYVNGKRVSEQALTNNDQILIGKYSMIFVDDGQNYIGADAAAAAPPPGAEDAGGMEPMHTYVMDGAKIRERLLAEQGGGAATDPMAPQARAAGPAPVAPASGASKLLIAVLVLLVVVLLAVVGVILVVLLTNTGVAPAPVPPPAPAPAPEAPAPGLWMLLSTLLPW